MAGGHECSHACICSANNRHQRWRANRCRSPIDPNSIASRSVGASRNDPAGLGSVGAVQAALAAGTAKPISPQTHTARPGEPAVVTARLARRAHGFALVSIAGLVGVIGLLLWQQLDGSRDASALVRHTYAVIDVARQLQTVVREAETGQRGFLLTGRDAYLQPYDVGTRADHPAGRRPAPPDRRQPGAAGPPAGPGRDHPAQARGDGADHPAAPRPWRRGGAATGADRSRPVADGDHRGGAGCPDRGGGAICWRSAWPRPMPPRRGCAGWRSAASRWRSC